MRAVLGAIEFGGSKVLCAVGAGHDAVLREERIPTLSPGATLEAVERFFAPHAAQLEALGIAAFGPLELDRQSPRWGTLLETPKPGWSGIAIAPRLQGTLSVPVNIDTDVNAAALAEQRWGSARGADPCVYITVGTGVGVGCVVDGRPLHGLLHPELGHLRPPDYCDFEGSCPFHGRCVEGLVSAPALRVRTGHDPAALSDRHPVWPLVARYLGHLVATCALAYAPRRIVLGGGVLQRGGLLEQVQREALAHWGGYLPRREARVEGVAAYVVPAALGQAAGLCGAFALAEVLRC